MFWVGMVMIGLGAVSHVATYLTFSGRFLRVMNRNVKNLQADLETDLWSEGGKELVQKAIKYQLEHQTGYHPFTVIGVGLVIVGSILVAISFVRL